MNWFTCYANVVFLCLGTSLTVSAEPTWQSPWATGHLAEQLRSIDKELGILAQPRLLSGVGPIGFRSESHDSEDHEEWIEVRLKGETTINEIILVPALYHTPDSTVVADGFPEEFKIWAIDDKKNSKALLASFTAEDQLLPRKSPLSIPCKPVIATRVRLEATQLTQRAWDSRYVMQFAEILIFCGQQNVGLKCDVSYSSSDSSPEGARDPQFLVDGVVPFLMDASTGSRSLAFFTDIAEHDTCHFDINLPEPTEINGISLHATDISDNVPSAHPNNFGIPRQFEIIGAMNKDFTDGQPLVEFKLESAFDAGPILQLQFPKTTCQFIRLLVIEPDSIPNASSGCIGLAEIECLRDGQNIATGSTVTTSLKPELISRQDRLPAITDGNNYYGEILPTRTWLNHLAKRHELEKKRPLVQAALTTAYQNQQNAAELFFWLSCLLIAIIPAILVIQRLLKHRAIYNTREQIAADLHDELGANLHAISLCNDLAITKIHDPEQLSPLFKRLHELTSRSGKAAKACVNLLESNGLYEGLADDIERIAGRLLSDIEYNIHVEGNEHLESLDPKTQIGVALFFKECLANVIRHSEATQVSADLRATSSELVLKVKDNGKGLPSKESGIARISPESLLRRARLLHGTVVTTNRPEGGTLVTLRTKTKSRWL